MNNKSSKKKLILSPKLLYTGFHKVETWWNYPNLISPFYRLFLITEGECIVKIEDECFYLKKDDLFLVPKFTKATYFCENKMEHYYACLLDGELETSSISTPLLLQRIQKASELDYALFKRLVDISPEYVLPSVNPNVYDNKKELFVIQRKNDSINAVLEREGIILQLFSKFVTPSSLHTYNRNNPSHSRISYIIQYINEHLADDLSITNLSDIACVSPDHFTKLFKKVTGMPPMEYIKLQKTEKACYLLVHTTLNIQSIAEQIGIKDKSRFSKFFHEATGVSPKEYRKLNIMLQQH